MLSTHIPYIYSDPICNFSYIVKLSNFLWKNKWENSSGSLVKYYCKSLALEILPYR